jgi:hypothetical protein
VNWLPGSTGIRNPACAITASNLTALSATVLPPVFGLRSRATSAE